jgi:hypothetical protein
MKRGFFAAHFDLSVNIDKNREILSFWSKEPTFCQERRDNAHIFHIREYLGFVGESCIKEEKVPQISP